MQKNPFKDRWKLSGPEFVALRKKQWPYLKQFYVDRNTSAKELKGLKHFFLEGDWPTSFFLDIYPRFAWTPSNTEEELRAVVEYFANQPGGKEKIRTLNSFAGIGGLKMPLGSPFSFSLGNEAMIAKVILGKQYVEGEFYPSSFGESPAHMPPQDFINDYESFVSGYLTSSEPNVYSPVALSLEYYFSCIHHLEMKGQEVTHHQDFPLLLNAVFNFVEGGQTGDKPVSKVGEYAALLKSRLTQDDMPASIKKLVTEFDANTLIEYDRAAPVERKISLEGKPINHPTLSTPRGKALRGISHIDAIKAFWAAGQNADLIPSDEPIPEVDQVDVSPLLSPKLIKSLGYSAKDAVPAYRVSAWYKHDIRIANHEGAGFGADLFLIVPKSQEIKENTTSVIYFPRLNDYYKKWIPSTILLLKERQVRRSIWEQTGKHLLGYSESDWREELRDEFMDKPSITVGYRIFKNKNEGDIDSSIKGPNVKEWKGDPLPELNLEEVLKNGDSK